MKKKEEEDRFVLGSMVGKRVSKARKTFVFFPFPFCGAKTSKEMLTKAPKKAVSSPLFFKLSLYKMCISFFKRKCYYSHKLQTSYRDHVRFSVSFQFLTSKMANVCDEEHECTTCIISFIFDGRTFL